MRFQVPWEARGPLLLQVKGPGWGREILLGVDPTRPLLEAHLAPPLASPGEEVLLTVRVRFPAEGVEVALAGRERLPLSRVEGAGGELQTVYRGTLSLIPEVLAAAVPVSERWLGLGLVVAAWQGEHRVQGSARLLVDRRSP